MRAYAKPVPSLTAPQENSFGSTAYAKPTADPNRRPSKSIWPRNKCRRLGLFLKKRKKMVNFKFKKIIMQLHF